MKELNLPISIEKFAAYLDGSMSNNELIRMEYLISNHDILSSLVEVNTLIENKLSSESVENLHGEDFDVISFEMPNGILDDKLSDIEINDDINSILEASIELDDLPKIDDNTLDATINQFKSFNDMSKTIQTGRTHYGETGQNLYDPIFIEQPDDHSCALRSQQIILRDFGIDIPFKDLERIALDNNVYSDDGTNMYDVGKVLEIAGIGMHQVVGSNMLDLVNELAQGHRVIVGVDANELWYNDSLTDKLKNWFQDTLGHQGGNHALIVAGVEVNPNNPEDVKVVLTDPGTGHLRIEYPMDQFMNAWKDTNCFMAATDTAAPYQYDPITQMEVPSNFVVEQYFNQFITDNSYQLAPDCINIPEGYQPTYSVHIDAIGNESYEEFREQYDDYKLLASYKAPSYEVSHEPQEPTILTNESGNSGDRINPIDGGDTPTEPIDDPTIDDPTIDDPTIDDPTIDVLIDNDPDPTIDEPIDWDGGIDGDDDLDDDEY